MKRRTKILKLFIMIGGIVAVSIAQSVGGSALSFQSRNRVDFTFKPTVSVTLSSNDLVIDDLTAGLSNQSNAITVRVDTNTFAGFTLNASVGGASNPTRNLTHSTNSDFVFSSINAGANASSLAGDNTWGYITCVATGNVACTESADWSNYNGLPLYTDSTLATLIDTSSASTLPNTGNIQFKIGAKAGEMQSSGSYSNQINFIAVTKVLTTTYSATFYNGTGASGMPSDITNAATSADIKIALGSGAEGTSAPTRTGYTFVGWCTTSTSDDTCLGDVYMANEGFPISNTGETGNFDFYAMWRADAS